MKKKKSKAALLGLVTIFMALCLMDARGLYDFFANWDQNRDAMADYSYQFRSRRMDFMGIHWVVAHGQREALERILDKDPLAVNARDFLGRTPLHLALAGRRTQAVFRLLDRGADGYARDHLGRDSFDLLIEQRAGMPPDQFQTIFAELLQWRSRRELDEYKKLTEALRSGDLKKFRAAWEKVPTEFRARVLKIDSKYYPSLFKIAAEKGYVDLCIFLIGQGDDPYRMSDDSPSAIFLAAKNGQLEVVKVILANGFLPEVTNGQVNNPVLAAFTAGHFEVVKTLLRANVKPFPTYENGRTILHEAIIQDLDDLAKFLIGQAGGSNLEDHDGRTPLFYALDKGKIDLAKAMLEQGADPTRFDREELMIRAARRGDLEVLNLLLTPTGREHRYQDPKPLNINGQTNLGCTALHAAAGASRSDVVTFLLDRGADVKARGQGGATPLHLAAAMGQVETIGLLLEHCANVNARDDLCQTPLHYAASQGRLEAIEALVKRGASIDGDDASVGVLGAATCENPYAPLVVAADAGQKEAVALLLNLGAKSINARISSRSGEGKESVQHSGTLLHLATSKGDAEMVRLLLDRGADPNARGGCVPAPNQPEEYLSPLFLTLVIEEKDVNAELVRELLEHGARLEDRDAKGRSALMLAASRDAAEAVRLLLVKGAKPNARDRKGRNALHWFAMRRAETLGKGGEKLEVAESLLQSGLEVNAQDRDGDSALHLAVKNGDYYLVKFLCEHGANPSLRNRKGLSPALLIWSVDYQIRGEILGDLIKAGGEIDAKFPDGDTPLLKAAKAGDTWQLYDLLLYTPDVRLKVRDFVFEGVEFKNATFLHLAAAQYHAALTELCLKAGFDVNARDRQGNTPLHLATRFNHNRGENIDPLIKAGADVNVKNKLGVTPLHWLVKSGECFLIEGLLRSRPDINVKDHEGKTPLHWLIPELRGYALDYDDEYPLALLLSNGADPCLKDNAGKTPLDLARELNNPALISRLTGLCLEP